MKKIKQSKVYQCPECKFLYQEKKWAKKCQDWCKKYHTCNIGITSHAVMKGGEKK